MMRHSKLAVGAACLLWACAQDEAGPLGRVSIEVSPLTLDGVSGATYTLTVANAAGPVWSRTLSSADYGDGAGALSYVGPCDATPGSTAHTIALELVELRAGDRALVDGVDFVNPAPVGDPLLASATCAPNADSPVVFDLVVARSAEQGFFDVAVEFDDIFCSAKLDCEREPGVPLTLLADPDGARALTAVLGFTCAAGPGQPTWLWMDRVVVTCEGGGPFIVDVADGPGNLDPVFDEPSLDLLFQAAVYRGTGYEAGSPTAYWNAALGLNEDAFAALGDCTLTATASATDGPLEEGVTPAGVRYPLVQWSVPLIENGQRVCTSHALDTADGVATGYSAVSGHGFHAGFEQLTGLVSVTGTTPDATSLLSCDALALALGASTRCTLVARESGDPIGTASGNFQVSASAGAISALSPAYGSTFEFQYTATATGPVVIDSGVGVTATLTVYELPDAATLECATPTLAIDTSTACTLTPRKGGQPVFARASDLPVLASAGTTSALAPSYGTAFTFDYTAPSTSQLATLTGLFGSLPLTITAPPDATSGLTCAPSSLTTSATSTCTITARRGGLPIYTPATAFTASTSAGTVSALSPTGVSTGFTFTLTAPSSPQTVTVGSGLSTTQVTVTATCSDGVQNGGETAIDCGGPCGACNNGQSCTLGSDCASAFCSSGTCAIATSCRALRAQNTASGEYTIDPDGAGVGSAYTVYCDMGTDTGGWTRVMHAVSDARINSTAAVNATQLANASSTSYAKLSDADIRALASGGQYEFMVVHLASTTRYIMRASAAEWNVFSSTGWTNVAVDAKNSAGTWQNNICNGHINNRGFSTYSDASASACTVVNAGSARYLTQHHTTYLTSIGNPFFVYVR